MGAKKDTYNYRLLVGSEIVYEGVTNNPKRRMAEHKRSGKRFTACLIR